MSNLNTSHSSYVAIAAPKPDTVPLWKQKKILIRCAGMLSALAVVALVLVVALEFPSLTSKQTSIKSVSRVGIYVPVNGSLIELAVFGLSAFRVGVSFAGTQQQIQSPMLADANKTAPFTVIKDGNWQGIQTSFGTVKINNVTGEFVLLDANQNVLTKSNKFATFSGSGSSKSCSNSLANYDVTNPKRTPSCPNGLGGMTQDSCCNACNSDKDCSAWVYATPGHESDGKNCWLLTGNVVTVHSATNRIVGGNVTGVPSAVTIKLGRSSSAKFYGPGCGSDDARQLSKTSSNPRVENTLFYTPHYHTTDGYTALGVSSLDFTPTQILAYPATWDAQDSDVVTWTIGGDHVDLYLTPAATQAEALSNYWDITGRPAIPPRYAFGFLACRWGWADYKYVISMLDQFRNGKFPLDAWISDFEWYTPQPDYTVPDQGLDNFVDFGYNAVVFPDPVNDLKTYHEKYNLRFGGIRKPRLGNKGLLEMVTANGWIVNADASGGAPGGPRNLNYSRADLRSWYADNLAHFLPDGVDFWWNDEGETFYFAFHWWNVAQIQALSKFDARRRFFTINRSYTPGMQRLGATQWTGDILKTWNSMQQQPGYVANWALAGTPYVTCDTGGFRDGDETALLLARWYQVAAFMPVMRVHSNLDDTPHFPFLFGDEAAESMRDSLNLRYKFLPYHYSLAHHAYRPGGGPIFRPMLMEFPQDQSVVEMTAEWMDGSSVLVCPVMNDNNSTSCYLPDGLWYEFGSTVTHSGPTTLSLSKVSLNTIPLYARAGSVIPLAPSGLQYSDQLPGGALEVHVYGGDDGEFTLVEDDGETTDYQNYATVVRDTEFSWNDATRTLTWEVKGTYADSHIFTQLRVFAYLRSGSTVTQPVDIGTYGSVSI